MALQYPNLSHNKVCYKGTALFLENYIGLIRITQAVENYKFDL